MWPAIGLRHRRTIQILTALVVISLVVAVVVFALRQRSTPTATSDNAPYAYLTSDTIAVARGSHVFATSHGLFGSTGGLMTTLDGRYVAAISEQDAVPGSAPGSADANEANGATNRVVSIDIDTGTIATYPCSGCTNIMAAGGSTVVMSVNGQTDEGTSVLILNLAARQMPHPLSTNLVPLASGPNLVAGLPGEVFMDGGDDYETTYNLGPLQAFVLRLNGKASSMPAIDSNMGVCRPRGPFKTSTVTPRSRWPGHAGPLRTKRALSVASSLLSIPHPVT